MFRSVRVHKESNLTFFNLGVNRFFEPVPVPREPRGFAGPLTGEVYETTFGPPAVGDIVLYPVNVGKTEQGVNFEIVNGDKRQDVADNAGVKNIF